MVNNQLIQIEYVPASQIYPCFGIAYPEQNKILLSQELSGRMISAVKYHELFHIQDTAKNVYWREVKANIAMMYHFPLGTILTIIKAVCNLSRLFFYLRRIKGGF